MKDINLMSIGELNIFINQATEKVKLLKNKRITQQVIEFFDLDCTIYYYEEDGMECCDPPLDTIDYIHMFEEGYISVKDACKLLKED